jgi:hypothetical protein
MAVPNKSSSFDSCVQCTASARLPRSILTFLKSNNSRVSDDILAPLVQVFRYVLQISLSLYDRGMTGVFLNGVDRYPSQG